MRRSTAPICRHSFDFAVGQSFPFWQVTVVCDDGVAVADILANRLFTYRRTRWMEAIDGVASGARTAAAVFGAGWRNFGAYTAATLHLTRRNDAFFQSMRGSIAAFHAALDAGSPPPIDGAFGAMLVDTCERMGSAAFRPMPFVVPQRRERPTRHAMSRSSAAPASSARMSCGASSPKARALR